MVNENELARVPASGSLGAAVTNGVDIQYDLLTRNEIDAEKPVDVLVGPHGLFDSGQLVVKVISKYGVRVTFQKVPPMGLAIYLTYTRKL